MTPSNHVRVYEVGPRDGLQNESQFIATRDKIHLIDLLSEAGFERIEATSFVSPKWVPQLRDAEAVMAGIKRASTTAYAALTPNMKGYEAARAAKADEVAIFGAASEAFSQKNINCSIAESLARFQPIVDQAKIDKIPVRGYVSCVVSCPYDGAIAPSQVAQVVKEMLQMGCYEVSLGDTIGAANPDTIHAMLDAVLSIAPATQIAGHYHDTNGRALDNIQASLQRGLRVFDSAIAGLGGCPYAEGASGNVSTSAVVDMLHSHGYSTTINLDLLQKAEDFITRVKER